jgi:hypothetical protein
MYKIRIFSSFCQSENCKDIYERLCEVIKMENYGEDKEIYITNNDDYTHVIILNTAMPNINIAKENVIGFAFEPPKFLNLTEQFINYARKNIGKYYIGDELGLGLPFIERYSHMWYNPLLVKEPQKNKLISMMVSEKMNEIGHQYRHTLVNKILETNLPIDIYGRGCKFYSFMGDERIKGEFKEIEPYEKYKFHICIENIPLKHYFSEKIMNPLLCNTTPIYLGCENIENYFPNNTIILTGEIIKDITLLQDICKNTEKYSKNINIEKVKDRIFLLKNIPELFSK